MAINETKIIVKAVDEATPVFNKIGAGAKGVGNAMDEVSRKAGGLTNYIKEQRKEGRQHSFIIGEMKDTLAVAGLAMNMLGESTGKGNSQFKKINDSVNKSIVVFMGLDAVVSGLSKVFKSFGGWIGTAVTIIGAITFGLLDYFDSAKAVEEQNKRTEESFKDLTGGVEALNNKLKGTAEANKVAIQAELDLVESQIGAYADRNRQLENQYPLLKEINKETGEYEGFANKTAAGIHNLSTDTKKLTDEYKENLKKQNDLRGSANILSSTLMGLGATVTAKAVPSLKDLKKEAAAIKEYFDLLKRQGSLIKVPKLDLPKISKVDVPEFKSDLSKEADSWNTAFLMFEANFQDIMKGISQSVNIFQGFSNNAFEERMNNYDQELDKLNKFYATSAEKINADYNARIAAAQGNAELENALEEEKKAKLLKLEEEKAAAQKIIDDKIKAEKRKNFIANQNAAIVQAIIDTSSAIAEALPNPIAVAWAAALGAAQIGLIASQPVPNFHTGGGMFFNAPADREMPVMVRGQETIRVTTPQQERNKNNGGVIINFNSPVSDVEFIKKSIKKVLNQTGLKIENAFVNNRNKVSFA